MLTRATTDPVWCNLWLSFSSCVSRAKKAWRSPSLSKLLTTVEKRLGPGHVDSDPLGSCNPDSDFIEEIHTPILRCHVSTLAFGFPQPTCNAAGDCGGRGCPVPVQNGNSALCPRVIPRLKARIKSFRQQNLTDTCWCAGRLALFLKGTTPLQWHYNLNILLAKHMMHVYLLNTHYQAYNVMF